MVKTIGDMAEIWVAKPKMEGQIWDRGMTKGKGSWELGGLPCAGAQAQDFSRLEDRAERREQTTVNGQLR